MNIKKSDFGNIKKWIYHNARPLDFFRWKFHFENGSKEEILEVLKQYQNEDGGFGNALEADSWNPNSTPYTTSIAVKLLDEIEFEDRSHPIIKGMLKYLENTFDYADGYWPAVVPSNNDYPHASWWGWASKDIYENWGYTPTAELVGFIITYSDKESDLHKLAKKTAKKAVDKYLNGVTSKGSAYKDSCREGEVGCYLYLLRCLEKSYLANQYKINELKFALQEQVSKFIERDILKWTQYCYKPSHFINSPDSILYPGNEKIMEAELEFILNKRNKDGIWDIVWKWGGYNEEFEISRNWWKSNIIIENLLLMRKFGKLNL